MWGLEDNLGWYGSLNVIGLNDPNENGTIRRCGLVEVGMTLLEKVCNYGGRI